MQKASFVLPSVVTEKMAPSDTFKIEMNTITEIITVNSMSHSRERGREGGRERERERTGCSWG